MRNEQGTSSLTSTMQALNVAPCHLPHETARGHIRDPDGQVEGMWLEAKGVESRPAGAGARAQCDLERLVVGAALEEWPGAVAAIPEIVERTGNVDPRRTHSFPTCWTALQPALLLLVAILRASTLAFKPPHTPRNCVRTKPMKARLSSAKTLKEKDSRVPARIVLRESISPLDRRIA